MKETDNLGEFCGNPVHDMWAVHTHDVYCDKRKQDYLPMERCEGEWEDEADWCSYCIREGKEVTGSSGMLEIMIKRRLNYVGHYRHEVECLEADLSQLKTDLESPLVSSSDFLAMQEQMYELRTLIESNRDKAEQYEAELEVLYAAQRKARKRFMKACGAICLAMIIGIIVMVVCR